MSSNNEQKYLTKFVGHFMPQNILLNVHQIKNKNNRFFLIYKIYRDRNFDFFFEE